MKVGVVYGTNRDEATVRIVDWIQEALEENGTSVVSGKHENYHDFDCDKIIVGSAVYGLGIKMTGIDKFLSENKKSLAERPLSAFVVCGASPLPPKDEMQTTFSIRKQMCKTGHSGKFARHIAFCLLLLLLSTPSLFSDGYDTLRPDTGGHYSRIYALRSTPDGRYLLSAGKDKTLRVWDLEKEKHERMIPGVIRGMGYGAIYDLYISPSSEYLFSSGLFGTPFSGGYDYRCIDFKSGETIFTYASGISHFNSCVISDDDSLFATGYDDGTVMLFDFSEMLESARDHAVLHYREDKGYVYFDHPDDEISHFPPRVEIDVTEGNGEDQAGIVGLSFCGNGQENLCVVTDDSRIILYDSKDGSRLDTLSFPGSAVSVGFSGSAITLLNRDEGYSVILLEAEGGILLKERYTLSLTREYHHMALSPDGSKIFLITESGFAKVLSTYTGETLTEFTTGREASAVCWIDKRSFAVADAKTYDICGYNSFDGQETFCLRASVKPLWAIGLSENEIAFGTAPYRYINEKTKLEWAFNLEDFKVRDVSDENDFSRIGTVYEDKSIHWKMDSSQKEVLSLEQNGDPILTISRGWQIGENIWCYGISREGFVLSGGPSGVLHCVWIKKQYRDGKYIKGYTFGHLAQLTAIAESEKFIVSSGLDGIINVYDHKEMLEEFSEDFEKSKDSSWRVQKAPERLVSILISRDGEYCIWTPDEYYMCSEGAEGFLYWQRNIREGITPEIYPLDTYKPGNNRPDIIKNRLR